MATCFECAEASAPPTGCWETITGDYKL